MILLERIRKRLEGAEKALREWQPEFFDEQAEIVFLLKEGEVPSECFAFFPEPLAAYAQALFDLRNSERFQINQAFRTK